MTKPLQINRAPAYAIEQITMMQQEWNTRLCFAYLCIPVTCGLSLVPKICPILPGPLGRNEMARVERVVDDLEKLLDKNYEGSKKGDDFALWQFQQTLDILDQAKKSEGITQHAFITIHRVITQIAETEGGLVLRLDGGKQTLFRRTSTHDVSSSDTTPAATPGGSSSCLIRS